MESDPRARRFVERLERDLMREASLVLCSSDSLRARAVRRLAVDPGRCLLVPNGLDLSRRWIQPWPAPPPPLKALFFGTIGDWIDFETLVAVLDLIPELEITMIGPLRERAPAHERLAFLTTVAHAGLPLHLRDAHCLLLPFRPSETVAAVDPVKLYEYVASGRPVYARRYEGIARFARFVNFYDDAETLAAQLKRLSSDWNARRQPSWDEERAAFLSESSWTERAAAIVSRLRWK